MSYTAISWLLGALFFTSIVILTWSVYRFFYADKPVNTILNV